MRAALRKFLCCTLIVLCALPACLLAGETKAAMVYAKGTAWLNGSVIPRTSAIFPGDLVQTQSDSAANLHLLGTTITVLPNSLVKFAGPAIELQHGGLTVLTSRQQPAQVGDLLITPASASWTEFWVGEADDRVTIMARQGDVMIRDDSGTSTLGAGQETTREESKKKKKKRSGGAVPAASGSILDSKAALIGGIAAVGGITALVLLQREDPISPDRMGR